MTKYAKTSAATANSYITKIQTFEFKEHGIENAWNKLKEYRRKAIAASTHMKNAYPDTALFLILTNSLPDKYNVIVDGFEVQQSLSVDDKLRILIDKEEKINEGEKAHIARRRAYRRNSNSDTSMTDFKLSCFGCGEEGHTIRECDLAQEILEYGRHLRAEQH